MKLSHHQLWIQGRVQGVGFRPYVYRLAHQYQLSGWVTNHARGVCIHIQGQQCDEFLHALQHSLPPMARMDHYSIQDLAIQPELQSFTILPSQAGEGHTLLPPDIGVCPTCIDELFDPAHRYHHYPFLNCMHCGPRFSITHQLPYDRHQTTMHDFKLCDACQDDYDNPLSRRHHAQPIACSFCGPQLTHCFQDMAQWLQQGRILTVKTLGSYQWLVNAHDAQALKQLRRIKQRPSKPLAIMVLNHRSAELFTHVNAQERALLEQPARPITVLQRRDGVILPEELAPGLNHLGIMLPSTALHYLLFQALIKPSSTHAWLDEAHPVAWVVTSANLAHEPLIYTQPAADEFMFRIQTQTPTDASVSSPLSPLVDHSRVIVTPMDDSVIQSSTLGPMLIRRGRGFVPDPIALAHPLPPTVGLGGQSKVTFCIIRNDEAFVSQHLGSLDHPRSIRQFHETLAHFLKFLNVQPERWVYDQHPDTSHAQWIERQHLRSFAVQHHHAHLASVMAEHQLTGPVLGVALDGTGYGTPTEVWGGELMLLDGTQMQRLGHFLPLPLLGGERAIREPWRMGVSVLRAINQHHQAAIWFPEHASEPVMALLMDPHFSKLQTTSCGRWFDAVSALAGVQTIAGYDGHAAMRLEQWVTQPQAFDQGWSIQNHVLSFLPLCEHLFTQRQHSTTTIANLFHGTLLAGLEEWICQAAAQHHRMNVVLGGGCFLNRILTEGLVTRLNQRGLKVYLAQQLPPNDGGLSLGQAWIGGSAACV